MQMELISGIDTSGIYATYSKVTEYDASGNKLSDISNVVINNSGIWSDAGDMKTSLLGFNDSNEISSYSGYAFAGGGNEGDELINKTCTIEGTTATVTLDNNNYNIIDTINATVTDLNINIQTSTSKYQKCWFEYDVAKNSVLTGVKSYVNNSEVPISCPSSYDSDKIYQGYSINYLTTINSIDKISPFGTVEVGGRSYKTVKMGNREWMAENLDYPYSEITIGSTSSPTEPRANYYNNDSATYNYEGNKYGLLYNMPALLKMSNDGQFPTGWRLPTTADFQDLFTYIGSSSWATKLCSTAWNNGTDDYGFNMLPAGYRYDGTFSSVNTRTRYWTTTVGRYSYIYYMIGTDNSIGSASDVTGLNKNQYPVRLVKTI